MKRCNICAHKLNTQGCCTNKSCPAYIKDQITAAVKKDSVKEM